MNRVTDNAGKQGGGGGGGEEKRVRKRENAEFRRVCENAEYLVEWRTESCENSTHGFLNLSADCQYS